MISTLVDWFTSLTLLIPPWMCVIILSKIYSSKYLTVVYRCYKKIRHIVTGKSELECICEYELKSSNQNKLSPINVLLMDLSIYHSNQLTIEQRKLDMENASINDIVDGIVAKKKFLEDGKEYGIKVQILKYGITCVSKSHILVLSINNYVRTKFDKENKKHEALLLLLWKQLKPDEALENRISNQWQEIGFQGKDPSSDFRGMGILGLKDLLYFSQNYPELSRSILAESHHHVSWYSFALVGIHITSFVVELVRTRLLLLQFYKFGINLQNYHEVYCYLFQRFHLFWFLPRTEQVTIMDFEMLFNKFKLNITNELLRFRTFKPIHNTTKSIKVD